MGNMTNTWLRIAMLVCVCGLLKSPTAQTFQRITTPFTCPNSENFDTFTTGVYSTLSTAVGTFSPLPPITGVMAVFSTPPAHSGPNYLWGRSQDLQWNLPQPACRVGGYFCAISFGGGPPPPSAMVVKFYDAQNLFLGSDTVPITTTWQWVGWQFQTSVSRIEIIGQGSTTPGYVGIDSLQYCPCQIQSPCATGCQIWDRCAPTVISTAEACAQGGYSFPMPRIAFDDWTSPSTPAAALWVEWWGIVHHWGQLFDPVTPWRARPFIIRIFTDSNGNCLPDEVLNPSAAIYTKCPVKPFRQFAGIDCLGRAVYRFWVSLWPGPLVLSPNTKYWIQISEDNHLSVRPHMVDFEWSGTCQVRGCQAVQMFIDNQGTMTFAPAWNVCENQPMDLAFCLGYAYIVVNPDPPVSPTTRAFASLRTSDDIPVWDGFAFGNENGQLEIFPEVDPGRYILSIRIGGALPMEIPVTISSGEPTVVRAPLRLGDLNGDGSIDDGDLLIVLFNFGSGR